MKFNTNKHLNKIEKKKRNEVERKILSMDKDYLKPDNDLNNEEKRQFELIVENSPHLSNLDNFSLNQLIKNQSIMKNANQHFEKEGLVIDGKKSPYWTIYKQASSEVMTLLTAMNLTPKSRTKQIYVNEDEHTDPIKELMDNE
ncbi:P27 family phage terminase small subunit [Apilactobacillus micheneri]|uniref:P27 family phage terminase small subunit n=1 Tax=Apilactobacillus micheneri TaxID=1899430 RepID=UPI001127DE07|nr:P27 family phage terminase small subunit [Apilactobacillus micheneri]TPR49845.1 hypothetical protein DY126_07500 [Apilactobacillus micheneri]